jgi:hypothetical protein
MTSTESGKFVFSYTYTKKIKVLMPHDQFWATPFRRIKPPEQGED